ncbi:metal ABC transporter substrate-binding protein [Demequina sp.]|uniref:metal ABC transporter substrate-binding protein n=1 Tax=Demequina sp. TaxID=2050685 RepID=UPI0025C1C6AB|nr:metal ABC transporter substrate-binding protein [Demequina sp.]
MARGLSTHVVAGVAAATLGLGGCAIADGDGASHETDAAVSVVASTTILGSVAGQVVECGGGQVHTLMPVGADPHDYSPSSADVAAMVKASLVVVNGLGLEEGLTSALDTAGEDGAVVYAVGPDLDPQPREGASDSLDPHIWMDVARMAKAASLIGDQLAAATGDDAYATCGLTVSDSLMETDTEVRSILDAVPESRRVLVTDHQAFGYFGSAYGFTSAGVVIPGGSTLAEPNSADLAALADTVRTEGVTAIFANTANPTALVDALAQEAGTQVSVVELYVGSLGAAGSGADTYQSMMLTDARRIADALAG